MLCIIFWLFFVLFLGYIARYAPSSQFKKYLRTLKQIIVSYFFSITKADANVRFFFHKPTILMIFL